MKNFKLKVIRSKGSDYSMSTTSGPGEGYFCWFVTLNDCYADNPGCYQQNNCVFYNDGECGWCNTCYYMNYAYCPGLNYCSEAVNAPASCAPGHIQQN